MARVGHHQTHAHTHTHTHTHTWLVATIFDSIILDDAKVAGSILNLPPLSLHLRIFEYQLDFPGGTSGKESACQCRRHKRHGFDPSVGKIPCRRAWQTTPYPCLENRSDRGAWWSMIHRDAKTWTQLKRFSIHIWVLTSLGSLKEFVSAGVIFRLF